MTSTPQPEWQIVARLGDSLDDGEILVTEDKTGVYPPEAKVIRIADNPVRWLVYRVILQRCTYRDGVLSDNPFHVDFPAWFADSLREACDFAGEDPGLVLEYFQSDDPEKLVIAYRVMWEYYGLGEFDADPTPYSEWDGVGARLTDYET